MLHALTAIAGGIELLTDLTLASVVLMALGRIADAIRLVYRLGRFCGWAWFRYGLPALLWTADGISWLNAQIDWRFVADTVVDCLKVIVSAALAAVTLLWDLRCRYVAANTTKPVTITAAVNPLFDEAIALEALTSKQLRSITGSRRRCRKAELIGGWMAA